MTQGVVLEIGELAVVLVPYCGWTRFRRVPVKDPVSTVHKELEFIRAAFQAGALGYVFKSRMNTASESGFKRRTVWEGIPSWGAYFSIARDRNRPGLAINSNPIDLRNVPHYCERHWRPELSNEENLLTCRTCPSKAPPSHANVQLSSDRNLREKVL